MNRKKVEDRKEERKGNERRTKTNKETFFHFLTFSIGFPIWVSDHATIIKITENLAKAHYLESKKPSDCAIFNVALGTFLSWTNVKRES